MDWKSREFVFQPIGVVRSEVTSPWHDAFDQIVSEIVVRDDLSGALDGIQDYSHLFIITWMDRVGEDKRSIRKIHPKDRADLPLVGVFATRTQYRPNSIGLKVVKLLSVERNVLRVEGLDAIDGTPVMDIKPYSPRQDIVPEATAPVWLSKL